MCNSLVLSRFLGHRQKSARYPIAVRTRHLDLVKLHFRFRRENLLQFGRHRQCFKLFAASLPEPIKIFRLRLRLLEIEHIRRRTAPGAEFPSSAHPDEYYFSWENGRILREWQISLIEDGKGMVEFRHKRHSVRKGSLIVLPPGCWHRYRPQKNIGWTTLWIGFGGDLADRLIPPPPDASTIGRAE